MTGTLYIVGTPIGNLRDITLRALDVLKDVEHILAEDTRRTRVLLSHFEIKGKRLRSVNAHTPQHRLSDVLDPIANGESAAFVTDAGMPSISDPGGALVQTAIARGISVIGIPGPSAVTLAAAVSGLVDGSFLFVGFLPRRSARRHEILRQIAQTEHSVVLFESPSRIAKTLAEIAQMTPQRPACVLRELTKVHEESVHGVVAALAERDQDWRGEITVILGAQRGTETTEESRSRPSDEQLHRRIEQLMHTGASVRDMTHELLSWSGRSRKELYARVLEVRAGQADE